MSCLCDCGTACYLFQCQDTLVQFGVFLATHLSAEEYQLRMPDLQALSAKYHLQPDVAFFLTRPMLSHTINVSPFSCIQYFLKTGTLISLSEQEKFDELRKPGGVGAVAKTTDAVNKVVLDSVIDSAFDSTQLLLLGIVHNFNHFHRYTN